MGTDNLFHKRRAKSVRALSRRKPSREPYPKVLIVCEGEKTEPHYFYGLRDHYGLNSTNVEVTGGCGSDPMSVYRYAKQRYREEKDAGDAFDHVFCVFDKDSHSNYTQTIDHIQRATPIGAFTAINSVPCFEYWLLLHFAYTTKPYATLPNNSAGTQVLNELLNYIPDYQKGCSDVFVQLFPQLEFAKQNAARSLAAAQENHTDNPSTKVQELIIFLQNIKSPDNKQKN